MVNNSKHPAFGPDLVLNHYSVRPNDTLSGIANKFNLPTKFLATANQITDPNKLQVGKKLIVAMQAPQLAGHLASEDAYYKSLQNQTAPVQNTVPQAPGLISTAQSAVPRAQPVTRAVPTLRGNQNVYNTLTGDVPSFLQPVLGIVRNAESKLWGYNSMQGSNEKHPVTNKYVTGLKNFQTEYRQKYKNRSGAAGAYQIMPNTLNEILKRLKLDPDKTLFDERTQDHMAHDLLRHRKIYDYLQGKIPLSQIRINLGKEWAGLPAIGSRSYYAGDNINKANVSEKSYLDALTKAKQLYDEYQRSNRQK